jgi:hypothetical protein
VDWYPWLVLVHILGAFGFAVAHGVSMFVAIRLRAERDRARVMALLDVSNASMALLYVSLLVLLVGGVAAGFVGGYWGRLWIWAAIGLLVAVIVAMYAFATPYYGSLRQALGQKTYGTAKDAPAPAPLPDEQVETMLDTSRPYWLAASGGLGLLLILWLMVVKPF